MSLYHNYSKKRCEPLKPDGCDAVADGHANQCSPKLKIFVMHGSCESVYANDEQGLSTVIATPAPAEQMWRQFCAYAQDTDDDWRVYWVTHRDEWNIVDECGTGTATDWEEDYCNGVFDYCGYDTTLCNHRSGCPRGDYVCSNGNDVIFVWGHEKGCTEDYSDGSIETCGPNNFAIDSWRGMWPAGDSEDFVSNLGLLIYEDVVENYYGESLSNVPHPDNNFLCTGRTAGSPSCPSVSAETYDPPWDADSIEIINIVDRPHGNGETTDWMSLWTPNAADIRNRFAWDGKAYGSSNYDNCEATVGFPCLRGGSGLASLSLSYLFNLHGANGTRAADSPTPAEVTQQVSFWSKSVNNCNDKCPRTAKAALLTNTMRREIPNPFRDDDGHVVKTETHGKYHVAIIQTPCLFETDEGEYYPDVDVSTIEDIIDEHCDRSNWLFIICFIGSEIEALPGEGVACADEPDGIDGDLIRFIGHEDGQLTEDLDPGQDPTDACCATQGIACDQTLGGAIDPFSGSYRDCIGCGLLSGETQLLCGCFFNESWISTSPCSLHSVYKWVLNKWPGGIRDSDIQNHSIVVHRAYTSPVDATDPTFSTVMHHETDPHQVMDWGDTIAGWLGEKFCGFGVDENYCCGPTIGGGTDMDDCASSVSGAIHNNWVDAMYEIVSTTYQGGEIA